MQNTYNISGGNQNAVGDNAVGHNMIVAGQAIDKVDIVLLANELQRLQEAVAMEAKTEDEKATVSSVQAAANAAKEGDVSKVRRIIASVGKWGFDMASKIGASLIAEMIKPHLP